ncbi:organelle RRM domain-containing protein 6, chloroplastic-like [Neltuma alba]|uniref:organelle RRM domain-containing protein 6, chloroplastic-like n=1 Tax=Neltuma alba TaxID=207710 RepID=UPI0010A45804|nr:organelle RRM domain-containing protein 6, chloroplastic-like [Prosopis alba]
MATTVAATPIGTSTPVSFRNNIPRIRVSVANIRSTEISLPHHSEMAPPSCWRVYLIPLLLLNHQPHLPIPNSLLLLQTKLYVTGISFRTTEESLRNAFKKFGELVEVNLVMDKIANRPRGFAFLRYATEEDSQKAIEGMHGKFLDGRVIFVEVAKPRSELRRRLDQNPR